jgi:hypothetical protein
MILNSFLSLQIGDIKIRNSEASIPGIIVAVYIFVRMCSREKCLLASSCPPVLLSICVYQLRSHLTDFHEILH